MWQENTSASNVGVSKAMCVCNTKSLQYCGGFVVCVLYGICIRYNRCPFKNVITAKIWFKHILFMTEHDKGLGRAKKLCLALSKTHTCTYNLFTLIKQAQ